ncbi:MAG: fumarylacetoacetate hydrolase family protein [Candidatus Azotimanducaceae bacterium WSBS_2022_MAG_OTU7]
MTYAFEPRDVVSIPVAGSTDRFPVNNIYCVGRNYADHAIEMGFDPSREAPFFFMKPAYAVLSDGAEMKYPSHSNDVHHEVELVVALHSGGTNISVAEAMSLVYGYGVGVDMTRRDLQGEAKAKSRPWEAGKTFLHAAPCSSLHKLAEVGQVDEASIALGINGEIRQAGDVNQMIWKVPEIISRLSELFLLQPGDIIYTGTPAGVGPVLPGDEISANIDGLPELVFKVSSS